MKKILYLSLITVITIISCTKKESQRFDSAALNQNVETLDGQKIPLEQVFNEYKGEVVFVEIWASWCGDCLKSIPKIKELKDEYGESVSFLYLSMDKDKNSWKNAIEKHELEGEHYYIGSDRNSEFTKSINLTWIPRFMIIGKDGSIKMYNAEVPTDPKIKTTLNWETKY